MCFLVESKSQRAAARRRTQRENILLQIKELRQCLQNDRIECQRLEQRIRSCEDQWYVQDHVLSDITIRRVELCSVPDKINEALNSTVSGILSPYGPLQQQIKQEPQ
jgi:hypothetical protein